MEMVVTGKPSLGGTAIALFAISIILIVAGAVAFSSPWHRLGGLMMLAGLFFGWWGWNCWSDRRGDDRNKLR
jgi:hypothetical protein